MTIYVYDCKTCKEMFEKNYPIGQAEEFTECPTCGKEARKILTPPAGFQIN